MECEQMRFIFQHSSGPYSIWWCIAWISSVKMSSTADMASSYELNKPPSFIYVLLAGLPDSNHEPIQSRCNFLLVVRIQESIRKRN